MESIVAGTDVWALAAGRIRPSRGSRESALYIGRLRNPWARTIPTTQTGGWRSLWEGLWPRLGSVRDGLLEEGLVRVESLRSEVLAR